MIYTIGQASVYDPYIAQWPLPLKRGLYPHSAQDGERYKGGVAFETMEAAAEFATGCDREGDYAVYKLDGVWERDTYQVDGEPYRRLSFDLKIIGKV